MNDSFHGFLPLKKNLVSWFDFNKSLIIKGFLAALILFSPIVFTALGAHSKLFFTLLAPLCLVWFFWLNKKELFWFGSFSGLLWFYWIAFSLYYYDMIWLAPLFFTVAFFYYGGLFWLIGFLSERFFWLRILIVCFAFDYLAPLGFDWMRPEMLYSQSYFGASKLEFLAILTGIAIVVKTKKIIKIAGILFFAAALSPASTADKQIPELKIELVQTSIGQEQKWDERFKRKITEDNIAKIDSAIGDGYDVVVLPETAFPYFLNKADEIVELLKEKSYEITIVTGALKLEANSVYNSTYVFQNGQMRIFDKVVAVPFGEVNPLPEFMSKIVNNLFFNGAEDYKTAQKPSDFDIKGVRFRNAICYEATNAKIYEDRPKYIIAMSNNAWFLPSFEPTIQKMLMKHMSVKYGAVIYHSANKSSSFIIS